MIKRQIVIFSFCWGVCMCPRRIGQIYIAHISPTDLYLSSSRFDNYTILFFVYEYREMRGCRVLWSDSRLALSSGPPPHLPAARYLTKAPAALAPPPAGTHTHTEHSIDSIFGCWHGSFLRHIQCLPRQ